MSTSSWESAGGRGGVRVCKNILACLHFVLHKTESNHMVHVIIGRPILKWRDRTELCAIRVFRPQINCMV